MDTSSSSSDEEIMQIVADLERPRNFRPRSNTFEKYSDKEFRDRYRFSKETVAILFDLCFETLARSTKRNHALAVDELILITLRFYATGAFGILVGDDNNVHKSTVSRTIKEVTNVIASMSREFIKMPRSEEEINKTKQKFYEMSGMPNVIGCIDGTHVGILSPGGDNAELFRNRKGVFSFNVQAVCNADLIITDLDARWQGSNHDSMIFQRSYISHRFETGEFKPAYLLGDSAYALSEYMMTPILNPNDAGERNYNSAHIYTRNTIERAFGLWKKRFPCLWLGLRNKTERCPIIIVATAVLHNIAMMQNDRRMFY